MNALLELRKQMEIDFLKTKTYEEINDMFNQMNDKLKLAESEVKKFRLGTISSRYLSAEKAKQITLEALKEITAKEYETKCVLEQIEEAAQNGSFEIQTYDDKKIRDNLVLLGYNCSEPFESRNDVYMKVSWS